MEGIRIPGVFKPVKLWKSVDVINAYTKRITETQPTLHAVIELHPDA